MVARLDAITILDVVAGELTAAAREIEDLAAGLAPARLGDGGLAWSPSSGGLGYLLKERVFDIAVLIDAWIGSPRANA